VASSVYADARPPAPVAFLSTIDQAHTQHHHKSKEWTAKDIGIQWQDDFFEHRLRWAESRREKADYILANPVRAELVSSPEDWP
jgi:hypothetical protein